MCATHDSRVFLTNVIINGTLNWTYTSANIFTFDLPPGALCSPSGGKAEANRRPSLNAVCIVAPLGLLGGILSEPFYTPLTGIAIFRLPSRAMCFGFPLSSTKAILSSEVAFKVDSASEIRRNSWVRKRNRSMPPNTLGLFQYYFFLPVLKVIGISST